MKAKSKKKNRQGFYFQLKRQDKLPNIKKNFSD